MIVLVDPVTMQTIAERIDVPYQTVRSWAMGLRGDKTFPTPDYIAGHTHVWEWRTVRIWLHETGRGPLT